MPVAWALPALVVLSTASAARAAPPLPQPPATTRVAPATFDQLLPPGSFTTQDSAIHTPRVPQFADVVLLVDGTASMLQTIQSVQANLGTILGQFKIKPSATRFGVAAFRDTTAGFDGDGRDAFEVLTPLSGDPRVIAKGVSQLRAFGGSPDAPEDWVNALVQISNGAVGVFRPAAAHIVILVGDSSSHDPSNEASDPDSVEEPVQHTLSEAVNLLAAGHIQVLGVGVHTAFGDGLNKGGQAALVGTGTGGQFLPDETTPAGVAGAIAQRLTDLPTTASHEVTCDRGLSVTMDPPDRTVKSGTDAGFGETISVAPDAPQGATLRCVIQFGLTALPADGSDLPALNDLRQVINVRVQDVSSPQIVIDDQIVNTFDPAGAPVTFLATAFDSKDGFIEPTCTATSGDLFPVGHNDVTCTATDSSGNVGAHTAKIIVNQQVRHGADVRVLEVRQDPRPGFAGGPTTVTATLTNAGPDDATGVVLDLGLPDSLGASIGAQIGCSAADPCTIERGTRRTVTIGATYIAALKGTVRATVAAAQQDLDPTNNTLSTPFVVVQPKVQLSPAVGHPGSVVVARGTDFPPGSTVQLHWDPGIDAGHAPVVVAANGTFATQVLVLRKDQTGLRELQVSGGSLFSMVATDFLVDDRPLPDVIFGPLVTVNTDVPTPALPGTADPASADGQQNGADGQTGDGSGGQTDGQSGDGGQTGGDGSGGQPEGGSGTEPPASVGPAL